MEKESNEKTKSDSEQAPLLDKQTNDNSNSLSTNEIISNILKSESNKYSLNLKNRISKRR
jgi:hypothetical protein